MAQHDYVIANGTGAAVRSDLNNALAAIVSQNSGATEPATMYAYQWWADTTTGLLKIRNAANNAWVTVGTLASANLGLLSSGGTITAALGSASTPGITFTGDTNTGIYSPGTDQVAISTNGTGRLFVDSSGNVTINGQGDLRFADSDSSNWVAFQAPATVASNVTWTLPSADGSASQVLSTDGSGTLSWASPSSTQISQGNTSATVVDTGSDGRFVVTTEGSERARIDSSGRLLVGTSSARSNIFSGGSAITPSVQFESNTNTWSNGVSILNYSGSQYGANFALGLSNSNTSGANGLVSAGNLCGRFQFLANDGTNFYPIAEIGGWTDTTTGTGDVPGRLTFSTTADGASSPTERMRITNQGWFKASNTGTYTYSQAMHEVRSDANDYAFTATNSNASPSGIQIFHTTDANNTGNNFLLCYGLNVTRATIRSNGGLANYQANNVNLSDINTKKDISPAADTWDCVKEWEIVNYRYKDQPDDADLNLGVIAQQVAESCPEVITVFEKAKDDQPEKLGIKEQQMYWMAIKALQEAQVRIETLEAKVAALEAA